MPFIYYHALKAITWKSSSEWGSVFLKIFFTALQVSSLSLKEMLGAEKETWDISIYSWCSPKKTLESHELRGAR